MRAYDGCGQIETTLWMNLITAILLVSVLIVPLTALYALYWAGRNGQWMFQDKAALLPFDEEEPVNEPTDQILNQRGSKS